MVIRIRQRSKTEWAAYVGDVLIGRFSTESRAYQAAYAARRAGV